VAGDFNLIVDVQDKSNARLNRRSMDMFRRCLNDLELHEANLLGRRYTWSNERETPTLAKLDRWFGSIEWDELHPDASLSALSSSLSDHCPILMSTAVVFPIKRRFRFERFWVKLDGFLAEVERIWGAIPLSMNPLTNLDRKLWAVGRGPQRWSQRRVRNIRDQLLMANELIFWFDMAQETRALSADELGLRRGLKKQVLGLTSLERMIARQRARVAGLSDSDANAQYFRILSSRRRRRNFIPNLRRGDQLATDQANKEGLATAFYVDLLGIARPRDFDLSLKALGL
jgi:hypothetical protein